mmetsp:Transcript_3810/g.6491  ORF Transcript_3810/g.6491 Transcript_3810/m.6491 type:complete len:224 (+) Transcript_3810:26-697(+)
MWRSSVHLRTRVPSAAQTSRHLALPPTVGHLHLSPAELRGGLVDGGPRVVALSQFALDLLEAGLDALVEVLVVNGAIVVGGVVAAHARSRVVFALGLVLAVQVLVPEEGGRRRPQSRILVRHQSRLRGVVVVGGHTAALLLAGARLTSQVSSRAPVLVVLLVALEDSLPLSNDLLAAAPLHRLEGVLAALRGGVGQQILAVEGGLLARQLALDRLVLLLGPLI